MACCCIYFIKNITNNKIYIGQTIDFHYRIRKHKEKLRKGNHSNEYLQRAWNKYGENSFDFGIFEECVEDRLDVLENLYIDKFNSMNRNFGYNLESGGLSGKRASNETKEKMSRNHADISGDKHPFFGKKQTEEAKKKISDAQKGTNNNMYGRTKTEEEKKHLSDKLKEKSWNKGKRKHLDKIDVVLEMIKNGISLSEISRNLNITYSIIVKIRDGKYF